jgi:hypothetical protein
MWSMIPLDATGLLGEWLASLNPERMPGNRTDGLHTLLTILPPNEVLAAVPVLTVPTEDMTIDEQLIIVASQMAQPEPWIILAPPSVWERLHALPHWRLWCMTSDEQLADDLAAVGLPAGTTAEAARELIKTILTGG